MRFIWYCPLAFEKWDWRSPDGPGVGGSETAVVMMARCLARRGHQVTVYADIREECPQQDPGGAQWLSLEKVDFSEKGVWILSRCPSILDNFFEQHPGQKTWLVCQDVFYPPKASDGLNDERLAKLDLALPLCKAQERYLVEVSPSLQGRTRISSNGFRVDLLGDILAKGEEPKRDPLKLVYTSSPDRGLPALLKIFKRVKEWWVPDLKLTVSYGWDNVDKCTGKHWKRVKKTCQGLMEQDGVTWLGRLGQRDLYKEFLSAGLWVYPTVFTETSCVSCMEAQALGAVPITNPLWALEDNVRHGVFLHGDPLGDPLVRSRYVGEIIRLTNLDLQEKIRQEMMPWARVKFDWEKVADQYEELAGGEFGLCC